MQFTEGTWKEMALKSGTALNQSAIDKGLVQAVTKGKKTVYEVVDGKEDDLQDLRTDPETSLTAGADYMNQNLARLDAAGLVPEGATDDEKAQLAYIAHHEGPAGAVNLLNGNVSDKKIDKLMKANMTDPDIRQEYMDANDNDKVAAYRAWLKDYARDHVTPDSYRCDKNGDSGKTE